jgi:thioredoxin reductase (NADPH)
MGDEFVSDEVRNSLKKAFEQLGEPVTVEVYTQTGMNDPFNDAALQFMKVLPELNSKIRVDFFSLRDKQAKKRRVERSPTILIAPDKYNIRFTGFPSGEEAASFIHALIMVSTGKTYLSDDSRKRLERLKEKRDVRVFVSPTCPYCPQQVIYAVSAVVEKKGSVSSEVVEIYENPDLAKKYGAMSVPTTYVDEEMLSAGLQPEDSFIESLVEGKQVEYVMPVGREELRDYDVVIIGGGPAGLTAAIYAERSGLKSIILEKANVGGQISITPLVENYPGFSRITGKNLVDMMARQALEYSALLQGVGVHDIRKNNGGFVVTTGRGEYNAKAIIIATGAGSRKLNVPGEDRLAGRGVSYCATCDGYIFKDGKNVIVTGGGNSALTDALYLDSLGAHVTVVHRRDSFRAEDRLQQSVIQRNIPVLWNSAVMEISGDTVVEQVRLENTKTGAMQTVRAQGIFIAIGYTPHNEAAKKLGIKLDEEGYIKVDDHMRTSVPLVYAAGDITGGVKQIVTAVSQGAGAALTVFEDIANPYWKNLSESG